MALLTALCKALGVPLILVLSACAWGKLASSPDSDEAFSFASSFDDEFTDEETSSSTSDALLTS